MPYRLVPAVLALVVSVACSSPPPPPAQGTPDDEVAIRGVAGKYAEAFNANNAAALARLVTDDFEYVAPDGTHTRGRAAFQQSVEQGIQDRKAAGLKLTLEVPTSFVSWIGATHAVSGGPWTIAGVPPGAPSKGSWIAVLRRSAEGHWQMTNSLAAEFVAPPAPPAKK